MQLTHDAVLLGLESQRVMGLRLMKLSRGGRAAQAEALRCFRKRPPPWRKRGQRWHAAAQRGRSSDATERMSDRTSGACQSHNQEVVLELP